MVKVTVVSVSPMVEVPLFARDRFTLLKSQMVFTALFNFFDRVFFIGVAFLLKLTRCEKTQNYFTLTGICYMYKPWDDLQMTVKKYA
jgi:hypothetical protein